MPQHGSNWAELIIVGCDSCFPSKLNSNAGEAMYIIGTFAGDDVNQANHAVLNAVTTRLLHCTRAQTVQ